MNGKVHKVRRIATPIALAAVAVTAALAPTAQATDKRDAIDRHAPASAPLDLRSPDRKFPARDWTYADGVDRGPAGVPATSGPSLVSDVPQIVDFRSADTRDAAAGRYLGSSPVLVAVPGDGFDWGDAGIGAGTTLAAMLLMGIGMVASRSRRPAHS